MRCDAMRKLRIGFGDGGVIGSKWGDSSLIDWFIVDFRRGEVGKKWPGVETCEGSETPPETPGGREKSNKEMT